ncbi:MAG: T9SS type A sorting domain-containing protein [Tannerellaceae bacterium]|jgi:hypothetical protein|nr:T9SS type A sorting domain-containing protein [Tannerellaceae bacterium]
MKKNVQLNYLMKMPAHLKRLALLAVFLLSLFQAEAIDLRANTPMTEGYIVGYDDPDIGRRPTIDEKFGAIVINIGNRTTATADITAATSISIYKSNKVSKETLLYKTTLNGQRYLTSSGSDAPFDNSTTIKPGDELRFYIFGSIIESNETYIVRLADDSDMSPSTPEWRWGLNEDRDGTLADPNYGIGVVDSRFADGDWSDQSVRVVAKNTYSTFADAQTVQDHQSVEIDILGNDILPDAFFTNLNLPSSNLTIAMQPKAGSLTYSGNGRGSRITYHHDGRAPLPDAVDSFQYKVTYNTTVTSTATVYIYVLQSATGEFSAYYGDTPTITLADKPQGKVAFNWFDASRGDYTGYGFSRTLAGAIAGDSTYLVQPKMTPAPNPYHDKFPKGRLTISPVPVPATDALMRWTGIADRNWKNPINWVEVKEGFEIPAKALPTAYADVIIPSGVANYPELTAAAVCRDIRLEDRAMIAGINHLTYRNAEVELKLKPTEKDRFVMYSAPLQNVYSGDYHYTNGVNLVWGDVYMNLFQQANPDNPGSVAAENMFTATFGNLSTPLPLGKAFNLHVAATRKNRDSAFIFPQTATTYPYADGTPTPALDRSDGNRFITDGAAWTGNTFKLPVYGGEAGKVLIQVVNPFMAYLDMSSFLSGNSSVIGDSYKIWNGLPDEDIIDIYTGPAIEGQRLIVVNADKIPDGNLTLIPPLQSFFVEKKNRNASVGTLTISSEWTTTQGDAPYNLLRSGGQPEERNLLRIKATQGNHASSALLCFDENASPAYRGTEDSRKLFYSEIPLSVYSLTPSKEPLAINTNGNYTAAHTALGLMTAKEGEVRLDFSGMATFGYDVYLIDNDRNGKTVEINLQKTPYYTFTAVKKSSSDAMVELNDRFSLRMEHRSTDNTAIAGEASGWNVSANDGMIHIRSTETISNLQIYNTNGILVYRTNAPSTSYEIRADHQQFYIIKAQTGKAQTGKKVFVP